MSRTPNAIPVYRKHKPTGQAVCTVRLQGGGNRDIYLGKHNSAASRSEFARIVSLVSSNGGYFPTATHDLTINELILAYMRFAVVYYRGPDGLPSHTANNLKYTFKDLKRLFGRKPVAEFGPLALGALRDAWIASGVVRKTVNDRTGTVKRMFRWAAEREMIDGNTYHRLTAVKGIRAGHTEAPDRPPVRPAIMADVEKAMRHMTETVRVLTLVCLHSGARAGEIVKLRVGDIDRTNTHWLYQPERHKGTVRGKSRTIYFGQHCRDALAPLILKAGSLVEAYIFSPARSEKERHEKRSESRIVPRYPSHMRRNANKRRTDPKRKPGDHYTVRAFFYAIKRACELAGVPRFSPHQLRHLAATRIRAELGVDVTRAMLGHSLASVTEIYSREVDKQLALKAVEKFG